MSKPKKRYWTRAERDVLLEIIKNYRHIVDNQSNNAKISKMKNIVWNHIANRFQELSPSDRDVNQLRTFWKRLKSAARKKAKLLQLNIGDTSMCKEESHEGSGCFNNDFSMYGQTDKSSKSEDMNYEEGSDDESTDFHPPTIKSEKNLEIEYAIPETNIPVHRIQHSDHVKKTKSATNKRSNRASLRDRKSGISLDYKDYTLTRFYTGAMHSNEMKHQARKHELEIENLMLERKRIELVNELAQKKLDILTSTK